MRKYDNAKCRFISTVEISISVILRKCSAIIYATSKHKFQITKQIGLANFNTLTGIVQDSEGKTLTLPDLLSRSVTSTTHDEQRFKAIEVIKIFMTHNQDTFHLPCHYSVSTNIKTKFIKVLSRRKKETILKAQLENKTILPVSYHKNTTSKNKTKSLKY